MKIRNSAEKIAEIQAYTQKGSQLKKQGKLTQAIEQYQQALQIDPDWIPALKQLTEIHTQKKEFNRALGYCKQITQLQPDDGMEQAKLARLMMTQGQLEESISTYQKAIALLKPPASIYRELGEALAQEKRLDEAITTYQQAISLHPQNPDLYLQLSELYFVLNQLDRAIEAAEAALEIEPNLLPALERLAVIHEKTKTLDKVIHYRKQLVKLQPNNSKFFQALLATYAKLISKQKSLEEAISSYQEVIQETNSDRIDRVHEELGRIFINLATRQGMLDRGISFLQKVLHTQSKSSWLHYYVAVGLEKQSLLDEAESFYRKALKFQPQFWQALVQLGKLLCEKGDREQGFQYGLKALKINPNLRIQHYQYLYQHSCDEWVLLKNIMKESLEKIDTMEPTQYYRFAQKLGWEGEFTEAISYSQKSIFYQLTKIKPQFSRQFWECGDLKAPDFLIIGVAKCGTSAIYQYLIQHPQILKAIVKEPQYLKSVIPKLKMVEKQGDWSLLDSEKEFYLAHFPPRSENSQFLTGEASTSNWCPKIETIVSNWFPKIKLIAIFRNPIERAISRYNHSIEYRKKPFATTIISELEFLERVTNFSQALENHSIHHREHLGRGLYVYYLERWMKLFPREQILILSNEDLARNPAGVMKQVCDFLGLPENQSINYTPRNVGNYPKDIDPDLLSRLQDFYRPHNQKLEDFLGRKFDWD